MKNTKTEKQDKPDVAVHTAVSFEYIHVKSSGKVKTSFYSNHKERKLHESVRVNLPEELRDGEIYTNGKIRSSTENSVRLDSDKFKISKESL